MLPSAWLASVLCKEWFKQNDCCHTNKVGDKVFKYLTAFCGHTCFYRWML